MMENTDLHPVKIYELRACSTKDENFTDFLSVQHKQLLNLQTCVGTLKEMTGYCRKPGLGSVNF